MMPGILRDALQVFLSGGGIRNVSDVVHEEESIYQYLQVQRRGNGTTVLIVNEGGAMQSIARFDDRLDPASTYYESYLLLPYMLEQPDSARVLVVGSGAGTIPHLLAVHVRPYLEGLVTHSVEIDRRATELGYEWFGSTPEDGEVFTSDGRMYLAATSEMYDVIVTDTYSNQIEIIIKIVNWD